MVYLTAKTEEAPQLARVLVEEELAACVNLLPTIRSVYSWKDQICDDQESMLIVKTVRRLFEALSARIKELHSYDTPEIIALPVIAACPNYQDWLFRSVSSKRQP